jgi:GMP synthase-like glutamine amidotransferase
VKVLALTHGPSVGPGVFEDSVRDGGHELVEWQVPVDGVPTHAADAVIVLGGAMHPDQEEQHGWLSPELEYLRGLLERGTPLFGVCLGSQLLARAAGASVFRSAEPEVGWLPVELTEAAASDPVAASLPQRFDAFQWHHYTHELPAGAVELARSRVCTQAFRLERAWGVQFHPEVRAAQVEAWLSEDPDDVADPPALREATRARIEDWNDLGRGLCAAFLAAV